VNPLQRFRGTDAARLDDLARRATIAGHVVTRSAAAIRAATAGGTGGSGPAGAPPELDELRTWLDRVAADARRRAELTRQAEVPPAGDQFGARFESRPAAPRLLSRTTSDPVLRHDGATGWHLQGYLGPGLSWRHLGTEHRTITAIYDHGDGWTVRETTDQHRAVFEVEVGVGIGSARFGGLGDSRHHDHWHDGATSRVYLHDGRAVSRGQFDAALGLEEARGE
jgi:hypothetical protein